MAFDWIANPEAWVALATLIALEIVLGIDNIIFISILVGRLPEHQRDKARNLGISLALVSRLILLLSLVWIMGLVEPIFTIFNHEISGRDIILIIGGMFLLAKSTHEIHGSLELQEESDDASLLPSFTAIVAQIAVMDVIFSLDSVITAVGLVDQLAIMVIAVIFAVGVMLLAAKAIGDFVDHNPSIKMLALAFLILIGFTLIAEGLDVHVPKGYIYFAMAFSFTVELLNIKVRSLRKASAKPIQLAKKVTKQRPKQ